MLERAAQSALGLQRTMGRRLIRLLAPAYCTSSRACCVAETYGYSRDQPWPAIHHFRARLQPSSTPAIKKAFHQSNNNDTLGCFRLRLIFLFAMAGHGTTKGSHLRQISPGSADTLKYDNTHGGPNISPTVQISASEKLHRRICSLWVHDEKFSKDEVLFNP